ncbi:transposase [Roseimarinus sediminis]|uniref:transposase n=1 Tax=Roseimarinus sediminis TaxID=1610899 RepID=UPI003D21946B
MVTFIVKSSKIVVPQYGLGPPEHVAHRLFIPGKPGQAVAIGHLVINGDVVFGIDRGLGAVGHFGDVVSGNQVTTVGIGSRDLRLARLLQLLFNGLVVFFPFLLFLDFRFNGFFLVPVVFIAGGKVTFVAKDYREGAIKKPLTLDGVEFLRRFTMHILPRRFVKIRRFGIYNHTVKRNLKLQFVPEEKPDIDAMIEQQQPPETRMERFERLTGFNPCLCPVCKTGKMVVINVLPRIRSPGWKTRTIKLS